MAKRTSDPRCAVGYVRVSTDEQGLGPEAQRNALERHCRTHGLRLLEVFEDLGLSGALGLDKRPGLLGALGSLRTHGAGVLLVSKRDRLARDVVVAAMAERLAQKNGARVLACDGAGNGDGPEAQLMRRMIDAFSEYERALIAARTRAALGVKKARGERVGSVPYGFRLSRDGKRLAAEPAEQRILRRIRSSRLSTRAIVAKLNAEGVPSRGRSWHQTTVWRLLARAR